MDILGKGLGTVNGGNTKIHAGDSAQPKCYKARKVPYEPWHEISNNLTL